MASDPGSGRPTRTGTARPLLREHHARAADPEEFNERLDKVFAAKTIGDLDELLPTCPRSTCTGCPTPRRPQRWSPTLRPRLRAADRDSGHLLREHHAAGRLTAEEFNERLDKVYAAKTVGDLDELLADLPAIDLYRLPARAPALPRGRGRARARGLEASPAGWPRHGRFSPAWQAAWGSGSASACSAS